MSKGHYFLVLSGKLCAALGDDGYIIWKFEEDAAEGVQGEVHLVRSGDLLKVYDEESTLVWAGVVAFNYEMMSQPNPANPSDPEDRIQYISGKKVRGIQGSARPVNWLHWFESGFRAKLEIRISEMPTHYDQAAKESSVEGAESDRGAERERMIHELLGEHDTRDSKPKEKLPTGGKKWWDS